MLDDIRCLGGLNIVRDSEVTCGSVPQRMRSVPLTTDQLITTCMSSVPLTTDQPITTCMRSVPLTTDQLITTRMSSVPLTTNRPITLMRSVTDDL